MHHVRSVLSAAVGALAAAAATSGQPISPGDFAIVPDEAEIGHEHIAGCTILEVMEDGRALAEGTTWPGGLVPYAFATNVDSTNQSRAIAAMGEIEAVSNVRFVARTNESNYVRFISASGNSSYIGMIGGRQDINIFNWTYRFIIVHEILHALSDWHEQQRPDRDSYVQINWGNIESGRSGNFSVRTGAQQIGPYDFESVMHYPSCGFSICSGGCSASCQTITVLPPYSSYQSIIGQRSRLSDGDVLFLTSIYGGGEVYNQTDDVYSPTIGEAIDGASSGDALISTARRFTMDSVIDFSGKSLSLESYAEISRPAGSTTVLDGNAALLAALGADMTLSGSVVTSDAGSMTFRAAGVSILDAGAVTLGALSTTSFTGADLTIAGDLSLNTGAGAVTSQNYLLQVFADGTLALADAATLDVQGEAVIFGSATLSPGATLSALQSLTLAPDSLMEIVPPEPIRAGTPAEVMTDQLEFDGRLEVLPGAMLDVSALALALGSSGEWEIGAGATVGVSATLGSTLNGTLNLGADSAVTFTGPVTVGDPALGRTFDLAQAGPSITSPQGVAIGDFDDDGDNDIVVASLTLGDIFALENNGASPAVFTKRNVSLNVSGAVAVSLADVDGDGDTDVLSAGNIAGKFFWHENLGGSPPLYVDRTVTSLADGAYSIEAADLDNDGDTDLVGASANNSTIAWFESDGLQPPTFTRRVIAADATSATSVVIADLDDDGDLDVVASLRDANSVVWYENDGAVDPTFSAHVVSSAIDGAFDVAVADMDGDGDLDIVSAAQFLNSVFWHENSGGMNPVFSDHLVADNLSGVLSVAVADLDNDGAPDVVTASQGAGRVDVLRSSGAMPLTFASMYAAPVVPAASGVAIGTLDPDVDLDIVATSRTGNRVEFYRQRTPRVSVGPNAAFASQSVVLQGPMALDVGATLAADALTLGVSSDFTTAAGASVVVSGLLDVLSTPSQLSTRNAAVEFDGAGGGLEAFAEDVGAALPDPGLDDPARGTFGALRILGGATLDLQDETVNASGQRAAEAIYVEQLEVASGATLNTNGLIIYYDTLTLDGAVDDVANLIPLGACVADLNSDGTVDGADLAALLSAWGTQSPVANIAGGPTVDGEDLASMLASWGSCAG